MQQEVVHKKAENSKLGETEVKSYLLGWVSAYHSTHIKETGALLKISPSELLNRWTCYLESECEKRENVFGETKGRTVPGLATETASIYRSSVSRYLGKLLSGSEASSQMQIFIERPVSYTKDFLNSLSSTNDRYLEVTRSIIVGKFIPWAVENMFLEVNTKEFERLLPVPYRLIKFPYIEAWIEKEYGESNQQNKGAIAQARTHLKGFITFVAETKLQADLSNYIKDSGAFLRQEHDGGVRIVRSLVLGKKNDTSTLTEKPYESPYHSVVEWIHFEPGCIAEYINYLVSEEKKVKLMKHTLSGIRRYYKFAHSNGFSIVAPGAVLAPNGRMKVSKQSTAKAKVTSSMNKQSVAVHKNLENIFDYNIKNGSLDGFAPGINESFLPTQARPGTAEKIAIFTKRVEGGYPLWHELDSDLS